MRKATERALLTGLVSASLIGAGTLVPAARLQAAAAPAAEQTDTSRGTSVPSDYRAVLDRYCVTCHNDRLRTANLSLDANDFDRVGHDTESWEKVIQKLRAGTMPPAGRPRPEPETYGAFASWLETTIDDAAAATPKPGRPTARRLNRTEYTNVIRDLLALEIDGRTLLPADDMAYGFDNNADMLPVSSALLERYMSAAAKVSRLAVGDPAIRPSVTTYNVSRLRLQDGRASPDLPFGSRGGVTVPHFFPLDAEYVVTARLRGRRFREPHQLDIRLDGERIGTFTLGSRRRPAPDTTRRSRPSDEPLEVRVRVLAGSRQVGVTFVEKMVAPEGVGPARLPVSSISFGGVRGAEARVVAIDIAGPYDATGAGDTASRRRIFVCRPADDSKTAGEACATEILSTLARRAYRRPVAGAEIETLLRFYRDGRAEAGTFDAGIQFALERILLDASFLVRVERDPVDVAPDTAYRLTDIETASRLSFFLWSSLPDDELLDLATRGALGDPAVLEQQVRRMLADPRASTLVTSFAAQWLHFRNLRAVSPDVNAFPEFDDDLREAFQRETELFIEHQIREDRSVLDLLTADYAFVNERLATHYGLPEVYGSHFRRVTFGDDRRRGLLGQGSILTVTSYANRTSPVVRGKWLLENILGAPPPPPPPDVPPLEESDVNEARSMRDRMEQHRASPVCASCHAQMDPLGFALENFDAIGKWRDVDEVGEPVDAAGALPGGMAFDGPAGLRQMLQARSDEFVGNLTSKLLTYALGRGVEAYDMPAIRSIMREAEAGEYRWSSIILGIAKSTPFHMRSSEP